MRYTNSTILNKDNKSYYQAKKYPEIPLTDTDIYVITTIGDRLDTIAYDYYQDATLWWILSVANSDVITQDTLFISPGTQLRIPTNINVILNQYELLNKIG